MPLKRQSVVDMTCYFRRLKEIFGKAGIQVTAENNGEIDKVIHHIVGVKYKNCADMRREVEKLITSDETGFVLELKKSWKVPRVSNSLITV
jgi:hypothetical protein